MYIPCAFLTGGVAGVGGLVEVQHRVLNVLRRSLRVPIVVHLRCTQFL